MKRLFTAAMLAAVAVATGLQVVHADAQPVRYVGTLKDSEVHQRQILVQLDTQRGARSASALSKQTGLRHVSSLELSYATYEIMQVPQGQDYMAALHNLEQTPGVLSVGPNVIKHVSGTLSKVASAFTPNDPLFLNGADDITEGKTDPFVKNNQWGLLQVNAPDAWEFTKGSPAVVVALLDTGLNFGQEDLQDRLWTNTGEVAGNSTDDDGNGFVDDVHGFDFQTYDLSTSSGGDSDPTDPSGETLSHGTATASIIAAHGNNGIGITGAAGGDSSTNGVRLMICRLGTDTNIPVAAEIAAIDYAVDNGAKVISMSFGGETGGQPEEDAINRAVAGGVLPIAAAGNIGAGNEDDQGNPLVDLPAGFTNCMAVGATTIFNTQRVTGTSTIVPETLAGYSKTGPEVDIAAPGTHIMAAQNAATGYTDSVSLQFTGTSAATPLVAALAGLVFSVDPGLTVTEARNAIETHAVDLGASGTDSEFGHGRVNFQATLAAISPGKDGDTNSDGTVNALDLDPIKQRFGAHTGDSNYDQKVDCKFDGVIDELDVFVVGRNFGN